jgi:hypothetical protein
LRGIYIYFGVILSISVELQQWMGQDGCLGLTLVGCWKMARGKLACEEDFTQDLGCLTHPRLVDSAFKDRSYRVALDWARNTRKDDI